MSEKRKEKGLLSDSAVNEGSDQTPTSHTKKTNLWWPLCLIVAIGLTMAVVVQDATTYAHGTHAKGNTWYNVDPPYNCTVGGGLGYIQVSPHESVAYSNGCSLKSAKLTYNLFGGVATVQSGCTYGGPAVVRAWGNPISGIYYAGQGTCSVYVGRVDWSPTPWHP